MIRIPHQLRMLFHTAQEIHGILPCYKLASASMGNIRSNGVSKGQFAAVEQGQRTGIHIHGIEVMHLGKRFPLVLTAGS